MYAHHFHHHLIGIGRAVKRAGAGAVVRTHFAFKQRVAPDFAFGETLAGAGFFLVADAAGHRARGHEDCGQVAAAQRTYHQAGDDFVAHAHQQRAVKHLVRQADGGTHRNHVARKQRKLHAFVALGDAVAHRGRAAGHLCRRAVFLRFVLNQVGEIFERLVCGNHVVVGRDDAQVRHGWLLHLDFDGFGHRRIAVRQIGTAQAVALHAPLPFVGFGALQVGGAGGAAAFDDALGNGGKLRVDSGHGVRPCCVVLQHIILPTVPRVLCRNKLSVVRRVVDKSCSRV